MKKKWLDSAMGSSGFVHIFVNTKTIFNHISLHMPGGLANFPSAVAVMAENERKTTLHNAL